jgi:hypothetical protein
MACYLTGSPRFREVTSKSDTGVAGSSQSAVADAQPRRVATTVEAFDQLFLGLLRLDSSESSADLLGERNEDALRAMDITEPMLFLFLSERR